MRRAHHLAIAAIGVLAAAASIGLELTGLARLDAAAYGRWLEPARPSGSVVVVAAEPGSPVADEAMLARVVGRLSRAGVAAIVLDVPPRGSRSGAGGEALLRQTVAQTGNVVVTADGGAGLGARAVGHTLGERAGAIATVPIWTTQGERRVLAVGLVAAAVATNAEAAVDAKVATVGGRAIRLDAAGRASFVRRASLPTVDLAELSRTPSAEDVERLAALLGGKIVVVTAEPTRAADLRLQAELADAVLGGSTLAPAANPAGWAAALLLGVLTAWLWGTRRWWVALPLTFGLGLAVVGVAILLLRSGVMRPVATPLITLVAASLGAVGWRQVDARRRLRVLETELRTARETLTRQESTVEMLEEDLEVARAMAERSAEAERAAANLREQLEVARAREADTRRRLDALARESQAAADPGAPEEAGARLGIVTRDPEMLAAVRDLEKAARSSLPILITGEPGTGKELFARAAHRLSGRAGHAFVAVNMAAIPPELFESELFGHARGSFTGAVADRRGWFEQADRGTIFLDEVGDLRADHQSKLLRVLQEKTFHRVGATRPTTVDVRVVAATNRDLERGVAEGWFREDLYFRLKGLVLRLPPLRERPNDIPILATRLLHDAAAEMKRPGLALSEAALAALAAHDWPGNVRELQNCLRQAAALADGEVLGPADLRLAASPVRTESGDSDAAVLATLRRHRFDMQATARTLGWDRGTVTQRLKGLGFRALVEARGDAARAAQELAGDAALSRTVELKLREYHEHLLRTVAAFDSLEAAVAACRRRFKNLPERHFRSLETLLRLHYAKPGA